MSTLPRAGSTKAVRHSSGATGHVSKITKGSNKGRIIIRDLKRPDGEAVDAMHCIRFRDQAHMERFGWFIVEDLEAEAADA